MDTYGFELAAGRDFNFDLASDSTEAFILNEAAVRTIGWASAEEAIDKAFHYGDRRGRIIGVVNDFNFESLHQPIAPIVFLIPQDRINSVSVKIREGMRDETMVYLKEQWAYWRPDYPFTHYFVENNFDEQYSNEERLGQIFSYFSVLAIIIAALGLLGLASFTAQQRIKEVGIRKVLGASVSSIVLILSRKFTLLVIFAFLIAGPLAYIAMDYWLESFAYRAGISLWSFLLAGSGALVIAWLTISYQSIKAALVNPVESLRSE